MLPFPAAECKCCGSERPALVQVFQGAQLSAFILRTGAGSQFEFRNALKELLARNANFEACQVFTEAAVRTDSERSVYHFLAVNVEILRI